MTHTFTSFHTRGGFMRNANSGRFASPPKSSFLLALVVLLTALFSFSANAQVTPQFYHGGGTGSNAFPFNTNSVKRSQHIYLPGDLPGALPGNILKIYVRAATAGTAGTYSDFKISLGQTTATAFPGTSSTDFFTNLTPVLTATSFSLPAQTVDAWVPIMLQIPFLYNPSQTLIVEFEMSAGSGGFSVRTSTGPAAPNHKRLTATSLTATTGSSSTIWTDFGIDVGPSTPCAGIPTPGTAVSSASSICPNTSFNLSLTGNSFASGITYQWQSSPNGTTWTNIPGATNPFLTTTQTATTQYQAVLTCSGQSANSTPVTVTTNATPTSGTFTINKILPASPTNFTTFASAINSFACGGLNGPIIFNVAAGSGPYTEDIVIPNIPGASSTNTITFNGNGNSLVSGSSGSDATLKLDGAKYVRINNLKIEANPATTAGTVVSLVNAAQYNTFNGCNITHSITTTSTSQAVYIYTGSSNNTFQNNIITGAYYGIYNYGASALPNNNNTFIGNTVKDFYYYGIYSYYTTGSVYEGNDVSRPTRTNATTMYGMYMSTSNTNLTISKNRIHNTHDAASTTTGTVYGIYTSSPGTLGTENIVKNNAIYNVNNAGGALYALYNSGGNNTYYYHNTVAANDPAVNYTTLRGMYFLSASTNVKFINNNISLSSPATTKHAIYLSSATIALTSNNNNLYVGTSGNVGYYSGDKATLALWQAANATTPYDMNSVSADPIFSNPATGDLHPTSVALNNLGQPLPAVTDDITGAVRNTTTPDMGAFEFSLSPNDVGITAISGPVSGCGLTGSETITVTIKNFGTATQTSIPVGYKLNGVAVPTETWAGTLAPNATVNYAFNAKANLAAAGAYTLVANTNLTGDASAANNTDTLKVTNSLMSGLPNLNFETTNTGINAMRLELKTKSAISEGAGASFGPGSTKGMIMDGVDNTNWQIPAGVIDPWAVNADNFAGAYLCFSPAGGSANDSLYLTFDLKQLFKAANANTNFRVTVNGTQVGPTYRPPFTGSPIAWQKVKVNLYAYKNLSSIQIGFESSVKEAYAGGAGTANLIDNVHIVRRIVSGVKDDILSSGVQVYPNPSTGIFNVSLPSTGKNFSLEVTDLTGKVIKQQTASSKDKTAQLKLNTFAQGVYLLKVTSDEAATVRRIVIQ